MATVYKREGLKRWYYKYCDEHGRWLQRAGTLHKETTERIAWKKEEDAKKRREGLVDPRAETLAKANSLEIEKHLTDWKNSLLAGNTEKHAKDRYRKVQRLCELACVTRISDLSLSAISDALNKLEKAGRFKENRRRTTPAPPPEESQCTLSNYVRAAKQFSRWLRRDNRSRDDSLEFLPGYNPEVNRRHVRRALTDEEFEKLVDVAAGGPTLWDITGMDRAMLYLLAISTGFRRDELGSLNPGSFELESKTPSVTVEAAYSKHRRRDVQPIRPDLAPTLKAWLKGKVAGARLFTIPRRSAEMIRRDLAAAGVPYSDAQGRVADFHSLRESYVTRLVNSGANIAVVQALARHSTPTLTLNKYTDRRLLDMAGALKELPAAGINLNRGAPRVVNGAGSTGQDLSTTGNVNDEHAADKSRTDTRRFRKLA